MNRANAYRVLVVEDDPLVRITIVETLEDEGFSVLQAANAAEAIAILQARADVLAVLSDIDMPGHMNGISLAWEVCNRWPHTPVTLISGRVKPTPADLPEGVIFVPKPLPLAMIVQHAERMVAKVTSSQGP